LGKIIKKMPKNAKPFFNGEIDGAAQLAVRRLVPGDGLKI
jgi:hypothetical protein